MKNILNEKYQEANNYSTPSRSFKLKLKKEF